MNRKAGNGDIGDIKCDKLSIGLHRETGGS